MADRDTSNDAGRRAEDHAVYIISVAAELAGVHPQTLRIYERKGLLRPKRTSGNTRRYSERDIRRLREILDLTQDRGINLAGVKMIIEMQAELEALRRRTVELEQRLQASRRAAREASLRETGSQILPLREVFLPPWEVTRPS
jgi:MerR family transcriptional regulator/heat shock protein HspR